MRVYLINEMTGLRAFVDEKGRITIEKNRNVKLRLNEQYINLLIKMNDEYSDINELYRRLCDYLEFDYTSVLKDF